MATFLQLCQDAERESGTVSRAARIEDVTAPPTPRQEKIVNWVRDEWINLQRRRQDWRFMRDKIVLETVVGQAAYPVPDAIRFRAWVTDTPYDRPLTFIHPARPELAETPMVHIDYSLWRHRYDVVNARLGSPHQYAIGPRDELCLGDVPNDVYIIRGEYILDVQRLEANTDVPQMPERWHDIIVSAALMRLAGHDEANVAYADAKARFGDTYRQLVSEQTPPLSMDGLTL